MIPQPHNIPVSEDEYELAHDYSYQWRHKGDSYRIFIAKGFRYDGASVPRIVWTLSGLTPDGLLRAASLVHDFIYIHKGRMPAGSWQKECFIDGRREWIDVGTVWKRAHADKIFGIILKESGVSAYRRTLALTAVKMFGGTYWRD
jgi:hypothetical protein